MPKRDSGQSKANTAAKNKSTDAIQMLKTDHRKVEALFDQFLEAEGGKKQHIAQQIFHELEVHSTLEEELFYPALQNQGDPDVLASVSQSEEIDGEEVMNQGEDNEASGEGDEDLITHAYDDHRAVRDIIAEIRNSDASSLEFRQIMIELQQAVENHVFEEEDELFAQAQLSVDTKTLGAQMQRRKQEILAAAA